MKYIALFCSIAILVSCQNAKKNDVTTKIQSTPDSIIAPSNPELTLMIRVIKVVPESFRQKIITSGIVRAIPNNYAEIASPFSGRIIRSFVSLGQKVKVGSPVFEISSPTFFDAGKTYYQSKQEMLLMEKNLRRQQDLLNNGVGTQKDLDEAEVNYELTKRDYENSIASLRVYHVNPEEMVLGQPLIVRSPINGEIVENDIVIGQYLKEDAKPVAIVAELSKVWVIGQLKEKDISSVRESDEVDIRLAGTPEMNIKGSVFHIGEILDEATRSVQIYVLCDNTSRTMKPGMYVTTQFIGNQETAILIPENALFQMEQSSFVFVDLGNSRYLKQKVEVGSTDSNRVVIKRGLKGGEAIVTDGGILLLDIKN
jgi:membrane fusion protein, heavy metal efflux system